MLLYGTVIYEDSPFGGDGIPHGGRGSVAAASQNELYTSQPRAKMSDKIVAPKEKSLCELPSQKPVI